MASFYYTKYFNAYYPKQLEYQIESHNYNTMTTRLA